MKNFVIFTHMEDIINILFLIGGIVVFIYSAYIKNKKAQQTNRSLVRENIFEELFPEIEPEYFTYDKQESEAPEYFTHDKEEVITAEKPAETVKTHTPINLTNPYTTTELTITTSEENIEKTENKTEKLTTEFKDRFDITDAVLYSEILTPKYF